MKHAIIPWIIAGLMVAYVYGLTYQAKNQIGPNPSYEFYDTTFVKVQINGLKSTHDVYGEYNNILAGQKELVEAETLEDGSFRMWFEVNSPRPARLYIHDETLEVLLMPGDTTLLIKLYYSEQNQALDSVKYEGQLASIGEYYEEKSAFFGDVHLRARRSILVSQDLEGFGFQLDSMAIKELNYLTEKEIFGDLPEWFVHFERNEILYQKAYLKLAKAYNKEVPANYLDQVATNNPDAMFSYYYYLYLQSYFKRELAKNEQVGTNLSEENIRQILTLAEEELKEGPHDVFVTRNIFSQIKENRSFANELFESYKDKFSSKKYMRYLNVQLEEEEELL
ncbi:MAG: hypothetical protein AAF696_02690 [Bacteroidota bacterium]